MTADVRNAMPVSPSSPAVVAYSCLRSSLLVSEDLTPAMGAPSTATSAITPSKAGGALDGEQLGGLGGCFGELVAIKEHPVQATAVTTAITLCIRSALPSDGWQCPSLRAPHSCDHVEVVSRLAALIACSVLAACGRLGFEAVGSGSGDGGIRPPVDSMVNGDAPDSAALFDCKMSHPTAMFCDGFEAPLDEVYSYSIIDNGRAEATTTRAYRGTKALEVETFDIAEYKSARWGVFYPSEISTGDLYLRAYYWISSTTEITEQASILSSGYGVDPYPSTFVLLTPGTLTLVSTEGTNTPFTVELPRDQWTCIELRITIEASAGTAAIAIDGLGTLTSVSTDTLPGAGYSGVDIGIHYATPNQAPVHMWIDEVIADIAPIGCD